MRAGLLGIRFLTLRRLLRAYGHLSVCVSAPTADAVRVEEVIRAVRSGSRFAVHSTCLVEALTAEAMLRRRGCQCALRIGMRVTEGGASRLLAHAWIERDGTVLFGDTDDLAEYVPFPANAL